MKIAIKWLKTLKEMLFSITHKLTLIADEKLQYENDLSVFSVLT